MYISVCGNSSNCIIMYKTETRFFESKTGKLLEKSDITVMTKITAGKMVKSCKAENGRNI